jgi:hypothetical protein
MKQNSIVLTSLYNEPEIERHFELSDINLKSIGGRTARHYASTERPLCIGDNLTPYIQELKSGYESLAADIIRRLQPEANFPDGKLDIERANQKHATLDYEIEELEKKIATEEPQVKEFNEDEFKITKRKIVWVIILMMAGETAFNTGAFQTISANPLFALILSLAITVAVVLAGHTAASLYKKAINRGQRIGVVVLSLIVMSIVFYCFALLRTWYLSKHGVEINPLLFVTFNMFFFVVMTLISFFFLPTWEELKRSKRLQKIYDSITKSKRELKEKKDMKEHLKDTLHALNKARIRSIYYAKNMTESIRARYREAVGQFIAINNRYRTDHKTPECFSQPIPDLNIDESYFISSVLNRKHTSSH